MTTLADLNRSVQGVIAGKRIGKPVFVRAHWMGQEKTAAIVPRLSLLVGIARDWLGQALDRLYALRSPDGSQVTITLQGREGGTAQVSFVPGPPRGDGLDVMILGNHGAIYHDAGNASLWDEALDPGDAKPDPRILAVVERSLRSGKPEPVGAEGNP
jgi:hypothetical protein